MQTAMLNGTGSHMKKVVAPVVTAERVKMTPAMAQEIIGRNEQNRSVSWPYVEQIARDIVAGRWVYDASPVRLAKSGRLLDGQHRCHAVVMAKRAVDVLLVTGLDDAAMSTIDGGRRRTNGDRLTILGEVNANKKAACGAMLLHLEQNELAKHKSYSFAEVAEVIERHRSAIEWAIDTIPPRIEPGIPSGGQYVYGVFAWCYPINQDRVSALAKRFVSGEGLTSDDPMKALRACVSGAMTDARERRQDRILRVVRAIEAGIKGQRLKLVRPDEKSVERVRALLAAKQ